MNGQVQLGLYVLPLAESPLQPVVLRAHHGKNVTTRTISSLADTVFKIIAIVAILLIVAILSLAATKSDDLHVERSLVIKASPKILFKLINDLKAWEAWTPYDRDPGMQETYSGPTSGVGATYAWVGNREAGQGSITITRSLPYSRVAFDLDMVKPFRGHNKALFSLLPEPDGTRVIWALDDKTPYAGKVFGLFVNLDRKIGGDFETGLARLKQVAETACQPRTNIIGPDVLACAE